MQCVRISLLVGVHGEFVSRAHGHDNASMLDDVL